MRRPSGSPLAVLAGAAALLLPAAAQAQDFTWRGRLAPGQTVEIKGVNGAVRAEPAGGDEVLVEARKWGRDDDPDDVRIERVDHDGGVTFCAVYPRGGDGRANECGPGDRGRLGSRNNDVKVEFVVRVPRNLGFVGRTVNGDVEIRDLGGDARAHTVNGSIEVSAAGLVRATTVNGSIRAGLGRADWDGRLAFETVNGGITVDLPEDVDADVEARTVNGSIETDFPLMVRGKFNGRRIRGTIGDGGRDLDLTTVNGSIHLRKR